ncbi:DUF4924 family protein [Bacteroides sp. 224]|uniref:DUF4924 family protein n=1 Tax=Bacteroides sp. 224 TaxID=2302936 RepID=UPI0013D4BC97|nr:DUF4924 family protein [Bacteroides sp. 224]NDV66113.1 DUF4924 family protein [Bacteroides sp. 224]
MYISQKLKESSIAEYLLYMWQVEDLIRAAGLDMDRLEEMVVSGYKANDDEKKELAKWYENLIGMMREEGVTQSGHLQINNNIIIHLTELHQRLLASPKFPFYSGAYYKALPFIVELRQKGNGTDKPEIETCFEALYGMLLLRMQQKQISEETQKAVKTISELLSLLGTYYHKDKVGELELD